MYPSVAGRFRFAAGMMVSFLVSRFRGGVRQSRVSKPHQTALTSLGLRLGHAREDPGPWEVLQPNRRCRDGWRCGFSRPEVKVKDKFSVRNPGNTGSPLFPATRDFSGSIGRLEAALQALCAPMRPTPRAKSLIPKSL